jgi:hypothetical protein
VIAGEVLNLKPNLHQMKSRFLALSNFEDGLDKAVCQMNHDVIDARIKEVARYPRDIQGEKANWM